MSVRLEQQQPVLTKRQIEKILPHRENWLLIDRVLMLTKEGIVTEASIPEEMCQGHFPGNPIVPGSLLAEAMSQAVAILGSRRVFPNELSSLEFRLRGYKVIRFWGEVRPGEMITVSAKKPKPRQLKILRGNKGFDGKFEAEVHQNGKRVAWGIIVGVARIKEA